jgi:hypothetical protein
MNAFLHQPLYRLGRHHVSRVAEKFLLLEEKQNRRCCHVSRVEEKLSSLGEKQNGCGGVTSQGVKSLLRLEEKQNGLLMEM